MGPVKALIFDCDGVLADTERLGHLPAFNRAFADEGVPLHWSEAEYVLKLAVGGGKERIASSLTPELVRAAGVPDDPEGRREWVARVHARKTELFAELVRSGLLPARPGVVRLVDEALSAGVRLAVASTSAEASVCATLEHALGAKRAAEFSVFAGDVVGRKKPDPAIYALALERLGLPAREAVAIEDSRNGLVAATAAGLACVVTISGYTSDEDFSEAALVVSSLGDPGDPADVIACRGRPPRGGLVELDDLRALLG